MKQYLRDSSIKIDGTNTPAKQISVFFQNKNEDFKTPKIREFSLVK